MIWKRNIAICPFSPETLTVEFLMAKLCKSDQAKGGKVLKIVLFFFVVYKSERRSLRANRRGRSEMCLLNILA